MSSPRRRIETDVSEAYLCTTSYGHAVLISHSRITGHEVSTLKSWFLEAPTNWLILGCMPFSQTSLHNSVILTRLAG